MTPYRDTSMGLEQKLLDISATTTVLLAISSGGSTLNSTPPMVSLEQM